MLVVRSVLGNKKTAVYILINTILLVGSSFLPSYYGQLGIFYTVVASMAGAYFIIKNIQLIRNTTSQIAWQNFKASMYYLAIIFSAVIFDIVLSWFSKRALSWHRCFPTWILLYFRPIKKPLLRDGTIAPITPPKHTSPLNTKNNTFRILKKWVYLKEKKVLMSSLPWSEHGYRFFIVFGALPYWPPFL